LRDRESRRRTERYEGEVESARELVLRRGDGGEGGWRDCLVQLLKVVDGMVSLRLNERGRELMGLIRGIRVTSS
jgi:hypothetical protein